MYSPNNFEKKWQEYWDTRNIFKSTENPEKEKRYALDMFPYPSGEGLHVGHPIAYIATDIYSRYLRMNGYNVLHPMGWDAFGLPAENFAIKKGIHPEETTQKNIARFREQLKMLGLSYDWSREINTSSPDYYRFSQWLFLQLYKHDLAYKKTAPVNWCTHCQTVLANEQVVSGACERCKNPVVQKELEQWFFRVTKYAEALLAELEGLDWPEPIKAAQRNWIGKSEGALIAFQIPGLSQSLQVFTTRPDTLFGVTYLVIAPEHPLVNELIARVQNPDQIRVYLEHAKGKSELERLHLEKEKTGVSCVGVSAINPANNEEIPVYIGDYVVGSYGTGAVMAVPAHDERDWDFAKKYDLPAKIVICPRYPEPTCPVLENAYTGDGHLVESGQFNGKTSEEAKKLITKFVGGDTMTFYRLHDWLISRQRYWGAPIPIIYCDTCGMQPIPEVDLPVLLPRDVDFRPTGESPLVRSTSFHDVSCPTCNKPARRESDTMDGFVCSSWYFLRYADPHNVNEAFGKEAIDYWLPVDRYVGGAEHAVLHLLYARFMTKVLHDIGFVSFKEPFVGLRNQGLILGEDGEKMSKSRGNVVNPDEIVTTYGADTMRLYEMFMGPFEDAKPWSTTGIIGMRRFLERVWRLTTNNVSDLSSEPSDAATMQLLHKTIKKVSEDIVAFRFNTAISSLMVMANHLQGVPQLNRTTLETYLILLSPFAPHMAEELWQVMGHDESIALTVWPRYAEEYLAEDAYTLTIQINGKMRGTLIVPTTMSDERIIAAATEDPSIKKWLEGISINKTIYVKGKIINFVIGE